MTLFTKLAAAHELLGALADQDGGLFPQQKAALTAVGGEIRSLLEEQPGLGRVIDEAPPLRRLLRAAEVLNRTGHTNDRPPALFEGMQKDCWCVFWQAELMGADRDQGDWPAELHYQRGGCHLVRASVLNPLSVPEARRRELRNDPARLRQERDRLAARFVEELRLAAAAFRQALKTPAVTATPRLPLKARTFEATAAVTLLKYVPRLTPSEIDDIQQNLNAFRRDTASAPVDAQLFSRLALLSVFCAKLTPEQRQLWSGDRVGYRERVRQLRTLGSALLLEWEGAEAKLWPSMPQGWAGSTKDLARRMLVSLQAEGVKLPEALDSPVACSPHVRKSLVKTFNAVYGQEQVSER